MSNIIDFQKEKDRILKIRWIKDLEKKLLEDREKVSDEIYLLSTLYRKGNLNNIEIIVSFNGLECYYGKRDRSELHLLKNRIDNIEKEIKFD